MSQTNFSFDNAVIGAGIGGLTAAYKAKKTGGSVVLLEKSKHAGGVIRSGRESGFLLEYGPNTVLLKPEIEALINEIGLRDQLLIADQNTPRFIQYDGKLHQVPLNPLALLKTSLLSFSGKLRLLREPFVPAANNGEESLTSFVERRLGKEAAERLMAPFVSGVWAGDPDELSAGASFPQLLDWEKNHGSIFKGALAKKSGSKGLFSFKDGMETLVKSLADSLRDEINYEETPTEIQEHNGGWLVKTGNRTIQAKNVVLTVPAWEAARLVRAFSPETSATLSNISYVPIAVLHLGFDKKQIGHKLNGFGYLVAPSEQSEIMGCLWSSGLFPDRAPDGKALLTVFMGGSQKAHLLDLPDSSLVAKALDQLNTQLKIKGQPIFSKVTRVDRAIPQYTLGHRDRMRLIEQTEQRHPGLHLQGNYRGGISVGDVIKNQFQNSFWDKAKSESAAKKVG